MTAYLGKLIPGPEDVHFDALTRIMNGEIRVDDKVRILGDDYHPEFNGERSIKRNCDGIILARC